MVKKFIITDPCYITGDKEYRHVVSNLNGYNWEGVTDGDIQFPMEMNYYESREEPAKGKLIMHNWEATDSGDGGLTHRGQKIGVDSGQLCIAEREEGWGDEKWGVTFATLKTAEKYLEIFLKKFGW